jgi:hypothetical protein
MAQFVGVYVRMPRSPHLLDSSRLRTARMKPRGNHAPRTKKTLASLCRSNIQVLQLLIGRSQTKPRQTNLRHAQENKTTATPAHPQQGRQQQQQPHGYGETERETGPGKGHGRIQGGGCPVRGIGLRWTDLYGCVRIRILPLGL